MQKESIFVFIYIFLSCAQLILFLLAAQAVLLIFLIPLRTENQTESAVEWFARAITANRQQQKQRNNLLAASRSFIVFSYSSAHRKPNRERC